MLADASAALLYILLYNGVLCCVGVLHASGGVISLGLLPAARHHRSSPIMPHILSNFKIRSERSESYHPPPFFFNGMENVCTQIKLKSLNQLNANLTQVIWLCHNIY